MGTGKHKSSTQETAVVSNVDYVLCPQILWTGTGTVIGTGTVLALTLAVTLALALSTGTCDRVGLDTSTVQWQLS